MKPRVLWIEDQAEEFSDMVGAVIVDGRYDLTLASNATTAAETLASREFHVVIVDIRLPPGYAKEWVDVFLRREDKRTGNRLGLVLLNALLRPERSPVRLPSIPHWVSPEKFGVLSVESLSELAEDLDVLGIRVVRQKTTLTSRYEMLEMIDEILAHPQ